MSIAVPVHAVKHASVAASGGHHRDYRLPRAPKAACSATIGGVHNSAKLYSHGT